MILHVHQSSHQFEVKGRCGSRAMEWLLSTDGGARVIAERVQKFRFYIAYSPRKSSACTYWKTKKKQKLEDEKTFHISKLFGVASNTRLLFSLSSQRLEPVIMSLPSACSPIPPSSPDTSPWVLIVFVSSPHFPMPPQKARVRRKCCNVDFA